jgi:flagellar basal-body rod protein FlgB
LLGAFYNSTLYIGLRKALDATAVRQKVYANNIANVDTPHFKRSEVNFEDSFKQALERNPKRLVGFSTDPKHMAINPPTTVESVKPSIWRQNDDYMRADDNNVDIDVEMAELAKNELTYNALVEGLNRKMRSLRGVIRRGG